MTLKEVVDRLADDVIGVGLSQNHTTRDRVANALHEAIRAALAEPSEAMKRAGKGSTTMFSAWNRMAAKRLKELE